MSKYSVSSDSHCILLLQHSKHVSSMYNYLLPHSRKVITYVYPADENVFFSFSLVAGFGTKEGTTALLTVVVVLTVLPCVAVVTVLTTVVVIGGFWTVGAGGRIPLTATVDFTVYAVGLRTTVVTGRI